MLIKPKKYHLLFLMFFLVFISCNTADESNQGWQLVFRNDVTGQTTFGDKAKLIDAVRLGYPVRIGWGGNRIEHVAEAEFLTVFQGEEVFAQTKTIIGQQPQIDNDSLKLRFRMQNHWTKIAGTNGYSTSFMTDYLKDSILSGGKDNTSATSWYVLYPEHQLNIEARPLWRKESPNWKKWETK